MPHVRVCRREGLCDGGRIPLKQQYGSVDRVCQRAGQDELASCVSLPSQGEVFRPERRASLQIVSTNVVEEQVMHRFYGVYGVYGVYGAGVVSGLPFSATNTAASFAGASPPLIT